MYADPSSGEKKRFSEYKFDKDPEISWEIVSSPDAFEKTVRELADVQQYAWDVETSGLSRWTGARIIGHAFAWRRPNNQIRSVYVPIRHQALSEFDVQPEQLDAHQVTQAIKPILQNSAMKIGHNLAFDVQMAMADNIRVRPKVHDSLIAAKIINENQSSYRLHDCLIEARLPHDPTWKAGIQPELRAVAKHKGLSSKKYKNAHGYAHASIPVLGYYGVQDAAYELRLGEWQMKHMQHWPDIWDLEMRLFWVCVSIHTIGMPVSVEKLEQLKEDETRRQEELAPKIFKLAGKEFSITNKGDIREILFNKLGLPVVKKTRSKLAAVDEDSLYQLEKLGFEIAGLLRQFNESFKITSTYTDGIIDRLDRNNIIHPEILQCEAVTGRTASRNPNCQNLPSRSSIGRKVKEAFVARSGMIRYCIDFSQLELRVLAHLSQDPILLKTYHEGLDAHSQTAIEVFGTADKVNGVDMRRISKILNFGTSFGMTEYGLLKNVNKGLPPGHPAITQDQATEFLNNFYRKYAGVANYRRILTQQAKRSGGYFLNLFGRPRRIPAICSSDDWEREAAERQLISTAVQGGAADLVKRAMVHTHEYCESQNFGLADMVLMVHDDLQFDVSFEGSARIVRDLKHIMETSSSDIVKLPVIADVEYFTTNWANKKSFTGSGW